MKQQQLKKIRNIIDLTTPSMYARKYSIDEAVESQECPSIQVVLSNSRQVFLELKYNFEFSFCPQSGE